MSWKTTVAGISTILVTILTLIVNPLVDGDINTMPQYDTAMPIIISGLVGLFARDNNKTSEQVGAK